MMTTKAWLVYLIFGIGFLAAGCSSSSTVDAGTKASDVTGTPTVDVVIRPSDTSTIDSNPGDATTSSKPRIVIVSDKGRGDKGFNDSAYAGYDRAAAEFELTLVEKMPTGNTIETDLRATLKTKPALMIGVGLLFAEVFGKLAKEFPDQKLLLVDTAVKGVDDKSNLRMAIFAIEQGSFLVGAAAALKSISKKIGFVGGINFLPIHSYEAGFVAGAKHVDNTIDVTTIYLCEFPDYSCFGDVPKMQIVAVKMYGGGVDVIYLSAGDSAAGLIAAVLSESSDSQHLWAIGEGTDLYLSASNTAKKHVLTSMLKRLDTPVYDAISDVMNGTFTGGSKIYNFSNDGLDFATSGDHIKDSIAILNALKQDIIDGKIIVPLLK